MKPKHSIKHLIIKLNKVNYEKNNDFIELLTIVCNTRVFIYL
jgi:hypothetical protein